jgi:hypothetical protein
MHGMHKGLACVENKAASDVFQNILTPFQPASVSSPTPKAEGTHSPGGEGDGGSIYFGRRQP